MCAMHVHTVICKQSMKALQRILNGTCYLAHCRKFMFRCYQDKVVRFCCFLITVIEGNPPTFCGLNQTTAISCFAHFLFLFHIFHSSVILCSLQFHVLFLVHYQIRTPGNNIMLMLAW